MARGLSKTRLMSFRQCPRRLWLETHRPGLAPPLDPATQALFDSGHAIGAVAHRLYDRGAGALVAYDRGLAGEEPRVRHGSRCFKPYRCPFIGHCWPRAEFPLTDLPGVGRKLDDFVARGYADVRDVPEELISGTDQARFWSVVRTGGPAVDRTALRAELAGLPYPRYHLDFETISFAVPTWPGTRPYQQLPFQWSLHVEPSAHGEPAHLDCLDLSGHAPMRHVASRLVEAVGPVGPVFMYTGFERQCLATLAALCTDLAEPLGRIAGRLLDLHPVVKRHYCHPGLHGSWSIKAVIPTIAPDMDYSRLDEIQDGGAAQRAYLEAIDPATPAPRHDAIRERLLRYCAHDTRAMVRLARWCAASAGDA